MKRKKTFRNYILKSRGKEAVKLYDEAIEVFKEHSKVVKEWDRKMNLFVDFIRNQKFDKEEK
jgi:hypothetical protein